jgi:hypothetical protein
MTREGLNVLVRHHAGYSVSESKKDASFIGVRFAFGLAG